MFLSKIIKINVLHIICVIKKDNDETYNVLTIRKTGGKINILHSHSFDTFQKLERTIDIKSPIILMIDGKGVLNKEIDFNNESDVDWYKNVDFTSIYHTSIEGIKSSFISFCRKTIVDNVIEKFKENKFQILDIYIGSFLSALLCETIKEDTIISNDLLLEFEENKIVKFTKQTNLTKNNWYTIGNEKISTAFLPLYGTMIHFYIQQKEVTKTSNELLDIEAIIYKKALNVFGVTMLIGFLISLLGSYILIQYYGSKNSELNLQKAYSNKSYQSILILEKQKENKVEILKESGFLSSKFLSFYGYEIIKGIPKDISLINLNLIPINNEIKFNKKISFDAKSINVKGETLNESSVTLWMEQLKKLYWLKKFEVISFKKDKNNKLLFEIKITLKDV